jgi:hypothetical protein
MKQRTALLGLAWLAACSSPNPVGPDVDTSTFTFNNFEAGGGWSSNANQNNPDLVVRGNAHSGQYALRVDRDHEYSLTYDMPLGSISRTKFKTVHLEAWVFMASQRGTATIGLQIMQPDGNTSVGGGDLKFREAVHEYGKWVKVTKDFVLPDNITALQRLRVFMWRADATEEVLLDDVKLSIKN